MGVTWEVLCRGDVWQRQEGNEGVGCTNIWERRLPFRNKNKCKVSGMEIGVFKEQEETMSPDQGECVREKNRIGASSGRA